MTETVSGAQSRKAKGTQNRSRGLKVRRIYTTAGVHPYDEVNWERRDVVMTNWRDGSINFEQHGVEFPDFWSVNAANIVTTKYFRGAMDTAQREWSLKQLVDRVVGVYEKTGREHGYFATDEDAEVFGHELRYALIHQVFSFNSPVWFNVGTASPQQCSACFILAVDDTIDSILEWYREEGLIFKGGSGSGVNLSKIRSSKELLSSGGTASGPVSFMRGADASAGTIKSGGATRRAAKMVVLDVDHPDIAEFIAAKAREEEKIRVLRDAGFDMDLGGKDIVSVQYQNANNSVRVSDEFMRAVEEGKDFDLCARLTGEVVETVQAKALFRSLAQAAWACADPGIQYDGTINNWHTCPESGRISASNPCSEYVHLDNSSCNLASINLLKFLRDDDTFDTDRFRRITELIITAMDISITFGDFPTEKIAATTRAYRQLGIGYANLGALLMATGHAYDSPGGRAIAASITSLMTGTAYKTSAEMAAAVGTYDGYSRNAQAHKRVIRMHADASAGIRAIGPMDREILDLARATWRECEDLGETNGYRNAQASLLAPTGTIGLMMDCDTTGIEPDLALVKFKKLVGGGSMQIVNQTVPRALKNLGYPKEQVEAIIEYIAENGHVVNAPGLRPEHYEVFDCAMGERCIGAMGHVQMMAAVQPHLSGAISKTVNMPESATVEDVERIYFEGWKLGLKALAIYRDNCKVGQPLSDARKKPAEAPAPALEPQPHRPVRRRLPRKRPATVTKFSVAGADGYMTVFELPGRRRRRGVPQARQAGLHPGRRDGRLLDRDLGGPAVRHPAGFLRGQVHQHALRAGRPDRRPRHQDRELGDGLHLPPPGARPPALRRPRRARHPVRARARQRGGRPIPGRAVPTRAGRRPRSRGTCPVGRRRKSPLFRTSRGIPPSASQSDPSAGQPDPRPRRADRPARAAQLHRADRGPAGPHRRRPALPHLRHQDAPGRQLLRLRRLRLHQRLQLISQLGRGAANTAAPLICPDGPRFAHDQTR